MQIAAVHYLGGTTCCQVMAIDRVTLVWAHRSCICLWLLYRRAQVTRGVFSPVLLQESNTWFCIKYSLTRIESYLDIACASSLYLLWVVVFRKQHELDLDCPGLLSKQLCACIIYRNSDRKASVFSKAFLSNASLFVDVVSEMSPARLGGFESRFSYLSITWMIQPIAALLKMTFIFII